MSLLSKTSYPIQVTCHLLRLTAEIHLHFGKKEDTSDIYAALKRTMFVLKSQE